MKFDTTHAWDRQSAIRHALARLERLPEVRTWSQEAPARTDERVVFNPARRERCCR
jgi:hypothetical protein